MSGSPSVASSAMQSSVDYSQAQIPSTRTLPRHAIEQYYADRERQGDGGVPARRPFSSSGSVLSRQEERPSHPHSADHRSAGNIHLQASYHRNTRPAGPAVVPNRPWQRRLVGTGGRRRGIHPDAAETRAGTLLPLPPQQEQEQRHDHAHRVEQRQALPPGQGLASPSTFAASATAVGTLSSSVNTPHNTDSHSTERGRPEQSGPAPFSSSSLDALFFPINATSRGGGDRGERGVAAPQREETSGGFRSSTSVGATTGGGISAGLVATVRRHSPPVQVLVQEPSSPSSPSQGSRSGLSDSGGLQVGCREGEAGGEGSGPCDRLACPFPAGISPPPLSSAERERKEKEERSSVPGGSSSSSSSSSSSGLAVASQTRGQGGTGDSREEERGASSSSASSSSWQQPVSSGIGDSGVSGQGGGGGVLLGFSETASGGGGNETVGRRDGEQRNEICGNPTVDTERENATGRERDGRRKACLGFSNHHSGFGGWRGFTVRGCERGETGEGGRRRGRSSSSVTERRGRGGRDGSPGSEGGESDDLDRPPMPLTERVKYLQHNLKAKHQQLRLLQQRLMAEEGRASVLSRKLEEQTTCSDILRRQMDALSQGHLKFNTLEAEEYEKQIKATQDTSRYLYQRVEELRLENGELQRQLEHQAHAGMCVVCMDSLACVLVFPCCHLTLCPQCATRVTHCPVCRASVSQKLRVYCS